MDSTPHVTSIGELRYSTKRNRGACAVFLAPHLSTILSIQDSELTAEISNSIVALDNLAKEVDSIIDIRASNQSAVLSFDSFENLEERIAGCFQYISDTTCAERLACETIEAVNISFHLNTVSRGQVYNLKDVELRSCTIDYLLPLVQYLASFSDVRVDVTRLFFLVANYVQILDDYVDVFKDIDANITTPLTLRWLELRNKKALGNASDFAFERLTSEVYKCLGRYLDEIDKESRSLNCQLDPRFFLAWERFHAQWIPAPESSSMGQHWAYLNRIHRLTPPLLCYS